MRLLKIFCCKNRVEHSHHDFIDIPLRFVISVWLILFFNLFLSFSIWFDFTTVKHVVMRVGYRLFASIKMFSFLNIFIYLLCIFIGNFVNVAVFCCSSSSSRHLSLFFGWTNTFCGLVLFYRRRKDDQNHTKAKKKKRIDEKKCEEAFYDCRMSHECCYGNIFY